MNKSNLPTPTAIIFDWDNTLVDTWPIIHSSLENTFNQMGAKPWSLEETKEKVGESLRDHFPKIFGDRWEEAGQIYQQNYKSKNLEHLTALPNAEDVLLRLADVDIFKAVVSNKQGPTLRQEAEHIGWHKYFHKLVGALDAERDKPFPDPALLALEGTNISANKNIWFIGDAETDVGCAKAAGFSCIVYDNPTLAQKHDLVHVNNHTELLELINVHH